MTIQSIECEQTVPAQNQSVAAALQKGPTERSSDLSEPPAENDAPAADCELFCDTICCGMVTCRTLCS